MELDFLKRLFFACSNEEMSNSDGLNMGELYERNGDAETTYSKFIDKLYTTGLTEKEKEAMGNFCLVAATAYECQGFINGVRIGVKLAREVDMGGLPE